jgi:hypothetical protein
VPEVPNTLIEFKYGTVCVYNSALPNELGASYWLKDVDDKIWLAANRLEAEEKLRELATEKFFERAEKAL